jgi:putative transposase
MEKEHENQNEVSSFPVNRAVVDTNIGSYVVHDTIIYRVSEVLDFESVLGVSVETGKSKPLRIKELTQFQPYSARNQFIDLDQAAIADKDWLIAEQRYLAIKPLLNTSFLSKSEVAARAKETNISIATLYRWLSRFKAYGVVSSLVPRKPGWKEGNKRITHVIEDIIDSAIKSVYLTQQRSRVHKTVQEVRRVCSLRGINAPAGNTVRERIKAIPERVRLRARGESEKAKNKYTPTPGRFPNADAPLQVVQIDHTPVDIILVDDEYRLPIGKPWITLAIDVYSRLVTGYYVSFDPPSETSVAMCVAHSICPKDEWLLLNDVNAEWPVWGKPRTIHVDNGAEFRSGNFRNSCLMHDINLEFRPVRVPNYGGHIERLLGTFLFEVHDLPGTTFSSIKERAGYDSDKHSAMTKSEFETWLAGLICRVYHKRIHAELGVTPLRQWEIGIFGNDRVVGVGLPPRPADRFTLLLDFMPCEKRTVQTSGVTIDRFTYYADVLRPWINSPDPDDPSKKRKFIFRYDPRDISKLWFFDPQIKQYFKIPFSDLTLPPISIWEYRLAKERLKAEGKSSFNEVEIFQAITDLRAHVEASKEKTKRARRLAQRKIEHEKSRNEIPILFQGVEPPVVKTAEPILSDDLFDGDIEAFGDIS